VIERRSSTDGKRDRADLAHPGHGFTFGYTVNQMAPAVPADRRSVPLVDAVLRCL
jgi:hypothetical protein